MKTAIYETDVQYDFSVREGALFVHANKEKIAQPYGAEERLPRIYKIHKHADEEKWVRLGSSDRHFYEDAELIRNEGGVFDDHCMNGTWGQLRLKELEPQKDIYIQRKEGPKLGIRHYSAQEIETFADAADNGMQLIFEKQAYDVATNPNFEPMFKRLLDNGLEKIIVNGFATDYCVKAAVLAMVDCKEKCGSNLEIYVVTDAIEEVDIDFQGNIDPDFGKKALEEMVAAGAKLVTTQDVLEDRL